MHTINIVLDASVAANEDASASARVPHGYSVVSACYTSNADISANATNCAGTGAAMAGTLTLTVQPVYA